jgi:hypothetical protein
MLQGLYKDKNTTNLPYNWMNLWIYFLGKAKMEALILNFCYSEDAKAFM